MKEMLQTMSRFAQQQFGHDRQHIAKKFQMLSDAQKDQVWSFEEGDLTSRHAVPTREELRSVISGMSVAQKYVTIRTPALYAQLRWSTVPYKDGDLKIPRLDIVQISVNPLFRENGVLTSFLKRLTQVVNYDIPRPRVVMIQSVNGPKLAEYIGRRPQQFRLVQQSQNNYIFTPSLEPTFQQAYAQRLDKINKEKQKKHLTQTKRQDFDFYSW